MADRETSKGNALRGLSDLSIMLSNAAELSKQQRFMARGLVEFIYQEVEAIQEVKRARREVPLDD